MEADFRVLRIMVGVMIPRVTLRSTLGYEPLAALGHSTFQVVLLRRLRVIKRVIISLYEDAWRILSICFDNGINWVRGGGGRSAYLHQKLK